MKEDERTVSERESDRKGWLVAWAVALALHVGAILILGLLRLPAPSPPDMPEPVDLVILPEGQDPQLFTEQPEDRANVEPENPDFVSNIASRAQDLAPGGDDALPRLQGQSDAPTVKLDRNESSTQPPATRSPQAPNEFGLETPPPFSTPGRQGPSGTLGNSDIPQPELDNPDGNAGPTGDVTLSTTDWNYSPWLQRFGRELMRRWIAPPAYSIGLLKDGGYAVIDIEITRAGKVLRVDLLQEQGHKTLIIAAQSAVRSMNPVEPLPADFPEQTLILRIRMIYPRYVPPSERRPAGLSRPGRR